MLLGRDTDLIKIAGRRTSLAALNAILLDIAGLEDGVLFVPSGAAPEQRPVLIYTRGTSLSPAQLKTALKQKIDQVFVPRTFIEVDKLPRNERGKLNLQALTSLYHREREEKRKTFVHRFSVPGTHPSLHGHFPGNPIVPGVVILDHILAGLKPSLLNYPLTISTLKFKNVLLPDELATIRCERQGQFIKCLITVARGGISVVIASGTLKSQAPVGRHVNTEAA
jgi:3-hydroxymyristoyl/3-hydroxydecanoyl-(acyl carrier protein) dehydratase